MHRLNPGIESALDADAEELAVVFRRRHIIDIPAMADLVAIAVGLGVVHMVDSVEAAIEVILIFAPGDAGHQVHPVAALSPAFHPLGQAFVDAVHEGDIRAEIALRAPGLRCLETGPLQCLRRVGGKGRWQVLG